MKNKIRTAGSDLKFKVYGHELFKNRRHRGPRETVEYSYDELGNITEAGFVDGGVDQEIQTYVLYGGTSPHAGMNRLAAIWYDMNADGDTIDSGDYVMEMAYDSNGNLTVRDVTYPYGGGTDVDWDYAYDADDRLIQVAHGATVVAEYKYDALGRRVLKKVDSDTEVYFYDGEDVVQEFDGATVIRRFVHGPGIDDYVAMVDIENGATYFYHTDGLGSITDLLDQSDSSLASRYQYAPFGLASVLKGATLANINPYEYTGRRYDTESGLMYYRSRYYDPSQRRFIQEDSIENYSKMPDFKLIELIVFKHKEYHHLNTLLNKYGYSLNNPINLIDPFGFESCAKCYYMLFEAYMATAWLYISFGFITYFGIAATIAGIGVIIYWSVPIGIAITFGGVIAVGSGIIVFTIADYISYRLVQHVRDCFNNCKEEEPCLEK